MDFSKIIFPHGFIYISYIVSSEVGKNGKWKAE